MLRINRCTKKFGTKLILNDVSLSVQRGEIAVLLGASGVGKSTLLRVLNNLETLDSGTVSLDGKQLDLTNSHPTTVGLVFQNFNLFEHLSVEENITLPLEKVVKIPHLKAQATARALLEHYGLTNKADASVNDLSGGQKQRLALARTLALKPTIICLDEPTSALDPLLTTHVARTIQELAKEGYIVLVATHDIGLVEKMNCTLYLMDSGALVETSSSQEFKHNKEAYPRLAKFIAGSLDVETGTSV